MPASGRCRPKVGTQSGWVEGLMLQLLSGPSIHAPEPDTQPYPDGLLLASSSAGLPFVQDSG